MTDIEYALEAQAVGRTYRSLRATKRQTNALANCSVKIPKGSIAAIVGHNAAGKSTLLRLAAGLDQVTSGTLKVLGQPAGDASLLQRVGYLDQDRPLYRDLTVAEHLDLGRAWNQVWHQEVAEGYLAKLGIEVSKKVTELSGGQRAQVALIMSMSKAPELLLLDEPAAALDPLARQDLLKLLLGQTVDYESTVILSTHDLSDVEAICDYVVVMARGSVALADYTEFVMQSHRIISRPGDDRSAPSGSVVIDDYSSEREVRVLVRLTEPLVGDDWSITQPTLQEIVLGYLRLGPEMDGR